MRGRRIGSGTDLIVEETEIRGEWLSISNISWPSVLKSEGRQNESILPFVEQSIDGQGRHEDAFALGPYIS